MSKLYDFLHPVADKEEKEVIISKRFVQRDDDGNVLFDDDGKEILAGGERSSGEVCDQDLQRPERSDGA